jgi:hypothetical protein
MVTPAPHLRYLARSRKAVGFGDSTSAVTCNSTAGLRPRLCCGVVLGGVNPALRKHLRPSFICWSPASVWMTMTAG